MTLSAPKIVTIPQKVLIGTSLNMSLSADKTQELWKNFMPLRKQIKNTIGNELFNLKVYPTSYFNSFDANAIFTKWALVEVSSLDDIPNQMHSFILIDGLYAVFNYQGLSTDNSPYSYIYSDWIPNNPTYALDNRPHFEVLGEKYINNNSNSEEEIYIPIKLKNS